MRLTLLFRPGKGEESLYHAGLVAKLVQVCLINKIDQQALLGAVAEAGADQAAHVFHQCGFVLSFFVVLKDQFKNVVQIDFLRFQQVHFKDHVIPVNGRFFFSSIRLLPTLPFSDVIVRRTIVLQFTFRHHFDGP